MLGTFFLRGFPFSLRLKTNEKEKKKRERDIDTNKSTLEKRNVQKEDLPSWNIQNESRFEHPTHSINDVSFLLFPLPTDNSRFIGIHIHRRDRTPRYSSNEQVTRRNGTFKRRSIGGPVEKETPTSPPCAGITRPIFEAHGITIWIAKSRYVYIYIYITVASYSKLASSHKFANCWSAVRDRVRDRARLIQETARASAQFRQLH